MIFAAIYVNQHTLLIKQLQAKKYRVEKYAEWQINLLDFWKLSF